MALSKKTRFEVFKRDSFTCQYCGRKAPEIVLECDHIKPVAHDGEDDITNLVTSCHDCNSGKSDRELDDATVMAKRHAQLADLQERREQLEMMMEWQSGLAELDEEVVQRTADLWSVVAPGYHVNERGKGSLRKWIRKFGCAEVAEAMRTAIAQYGDSDTDGAPTKDSIEKAFCMVPKIAGVTRDQVKQPWLKDAFYIRGIVRNRFTDCDQGRAIGIIKEAFESGAEADELKYVAANARYWSEWLEDMRRYI